MPVMDKWNQEKTRLSPFLQGVLVAGCPAALIILVLLCSGSVLSSSFIISTACPWPRISGNGVDLMAAQSFDIQNLLMVSTKLVAGVARTQNTVTSSSSSSAMFSWDLDRRSSQLRLNETILSILRQHRSSNIPEALEMLGPSICSHPVLITECCGGNFGTSLMRVGLAVKLGLLLNRTTVLEVYEGAEDEAEYFELPFITRARLWRLYRKHKCNVPGMEREDTHKVLLGGNFTLVPTMLAEMKKLQGVGASYCGSDPFIKRETDASGRWWNFLVCGNLSTLPNLLWLHPGDAFQPTDLLQHNPYFSLPQWLVGIVQPSDRIYREIFYSFLKPNAAVRAVVQQFTQGSGFDYMIHLRWSEWDTHVGLALYSFLSILNATTNSTLEVVKETGAPLYQGPPRNRPLRLLIASSNFPSSDFCAFVVSNASLIIDWHQAVSKAPLTFSSVDCRYFDAHRHAVEFGLPPTLSVTQVNFQPWDWGVHPSWAAIVEVFSVFPLNNALLSLQMSNFAALFRTVSGKASYDFAGVRNVNEHVFWPF